MSKFVKALSFGLRVFRLVEGSVDIKGIPATVIDQAVTSAVKTIVDAHSK